MAIISRPKQDELKLDLYDKKIIFYLSQNSRMPLTQLAKNLKISVQRCKYKVERLQKEILEPAAFMTFPLLGINSYMIFIPHLVQDVVKGIADDEAVFFIMQCIGKYQYVVNVVTNNINNFLREHLPEAIIDVHKITNSYADDYNPFGLDIQPKPLLKNKEIGLDSKDYKILAHLGMKPTDSLLNMQHVTKIDRQTIKERIKKLEAVNIIQKFRYGINIFKMGYIAYILKISVSITKKKTILSAIRNNKYSGFVFESYFGFSMNYLPPSHNELFEFTNALMTIDPSLEITVLQNTESYNVSLVPMSAVKFFKKQQIS